MLSKLSKSRIIVVGDVMLDVYFSGEVNRISPEAPVPVFWIRQKNATLGAAGNVALNLAKLGCSVDLFGVRGNDAYGEKMSRILRDNGINDRLIVDRAHITTTKTRLVGERQQLIRLDEEEIWECGKKYKSQILQNIEKVLKKANGVILSDYSKGVLTGQITQNIIKLCKVYGRPVFVDPKRKAWERYYGATCITPNISEMEEISGIKIGSDEKKLVKEANRLRKLYKFDWFLATRGRAGMCLVGSDKEPTFISSAAREVFDVSGAGDTVIATFAAAVSSGIPMKVAAEISNLAAGIVVGKVGSQPITIMELESAWKSKELGIIGVNSHKISTLHSAQLRTQTWKAVGEKVVVTHGFFDNINPIHVRDLNQAKTLGDHLVVIVYSDKFSKKYRGKNGLLSNQKDRADMLSALQCVDLVILLDKEQIQSMFEILKPDVFIKSGSYLLDNLIQNNYIISHNCKVAKIRI
jgi:D-beta-D-heptose 7-phosphate kinase/D-beta-D-heptose 1-phosphate adenosyltransferase